MQGRNEKHLNSKGEDGGMREGGVGGGGGDGGRDLPEDTGGSDWVRISPPPPPPTPFFSLFFPLSLSPHTNCEMQMRGKVKRLHSAPFVCCAWRGKRVCGGVFVPAVRWGHPIPVSASDCMLRCTRRQCDAPHNATYRCCQCLLPPPPSITQPDFPYSPPPHTLLHSPFSSLSIPVPSLATSPLSLPPVLFRSTIYPTILSLSPSLS